MVGDEQQRPTVRRLGPLQRAELVSREVAELNSQLGGGHPIGHLGLKHQLQHVGHALVIAERLSGRFQAGQERHIGRFPNQGLAQRHPFALAIAAGQKQIGAAQVQLGALAGGCEHHRLVEGPQLGLRLVQRASQIGGALPQRGERRLLERARHRRLRHAGGFGRRWQLRQQVDRRDQGCASVAIWLPRCQRQVQLGSQTEVPCALMEAGKLARWLSLGRQEIEGVLPESPELAVESLRRCRASSSDCTRLLGPQPAARRRP